MEAAYSFSALGTLGPCGRLLCMAYGNRSIHRNANPTYFIRWKTYKSCATAAGFAGVADFDFYQSGTLLALNTFGSYLLSCISLPLVCLSAPQLARLLAWSPKAPFELMPPRTDHESGRVGGASKRLPSAMVDCKEGCRAVGDGIGLDHGGAEQFRNGNMSTFSGFNGTHIWCIQQT